jgi:hypothetical protein
LKIQLSTNIISKGYHTYLTILIFHFFPLDDDSMLYSMTKLAAKESDSKKTPKKKEDPKAKPEPIKKEHKSPKPRPSEAPQHPKTPLTTSPALAPTARHPPRKCRIRRRTRT